MPRSTDSERLERIESLLQRLDAAVVVREPGNARSADAFDGLRKLLIQSGSSQRSHVAHLLSLSDSLERGAGLDLIRDRVADFLLELGISRSTDASQLDHFDVVEGSGSRIECLTPAVIQTLADRSIFVVRKGTARRVDDQPSPVIGVDSANVAASESEPAPMAPTPASRDRTAASALIGIGALGLALGVLLSQLF